MRSDPFMQRSANVCQRYVNILHQVIILDTRRKLNCNIYNTTPFTPQFNVDCVLGRAVIQTTFTLEFHLSCWALPHQHWIRGAGGGSQWQIKNEISYFGCNLLSVPSTPHMCQIARSCCFCWNGRTQRAETITDTLTQTQTQTQTDTDTNTDTDRHRHRHWQSQTHRDSSVVMKIPFYGKF